MYSKEITIKFRDADPAGILFFGNIFSMAHDTFEDFIQAAGFTWREWFKTTELMVPIRHTEANFLSPFCPGETYVVLAGVEKFGQTSLQMKYQFKHGAKVHAEVTMVHSFLDAKTNKKVDIPDNIKSRLEKHLWQNR